MKAILHVVILCITVWGFSGCTTQSEPKNKIIVFGDSLSIGSSWVWYLNRNIPEYAFDVHAQIGVNTDLIREWADPSLVDYREYSYMMILTGVNDSCGSEHTSVNLKYILRVAKENNPDIKTVCIEYPDWSTYPTWTPAGQQNLDQVYALLKEDMNTDFYVADPLVDPIYKVDGLHLSELGKETLASIVYATVFSSR
jgi:lysophospholipase L1-like esterase